MVVCCVLCISVRLVMKVVLLLGSSLKSRSLSGGGVLLLGRPRVSIGIGNVGRCSMVRIRLWVSGLIMW